MNQQSQARKSPDRAWVLCPVLFEVAGADRDREARLAEAVGLTAAIDLQIAGSSIVPVRQIRPATMFGSGKVAEIGRQLEINEVGLVIVDASLTPIQQRNLESAWHAKVIDRTGLILEIFGERARTREGVIQVELAALSYQRSRLVRSWTHLERQRGGLGFLGGPGESQLELDRRRIDERLAMLKRELADVKRTRGLHRKARSDVPYPIVALAGYTNAGKSTLFNRLTRARVMAEDKLFATLDPTMRLVRLPSGRQVIFSDTVGFITDLPTSLVAAFQATLEEVTAADVILHVRDISHNETDLQAQEVTKILGELGIDEQRRKDVIIEAWNKIDLLDQDQLADLGCHRERHENVAMISSVTGDGLDDLLTRIDERLSRNDRIVELDLSYKQGALLNWLHQQGRVLDREDSETGTHLRVALSAEAESQLRHKLAQP